MYDLTSGIVSEHDCLYIAASSYRSETDFNQIIPYCLSEWPSQWHIEENKLDQKLTFSYLRQHNITSQQLYVWSAPIDIIERYQRYLSQSDSSLESQVFYNCTSPTFGPFCQYSLDIHGIRHSSLHEIIYDFYQEGYNPETLTCYTHLKCDRGSVIACLDWTEICDGYIDCLNGGVDEEDCWQIGMNECRNDEYRCYNGQCIHMIFAHDGRDTYECLDASDEYSDTSMTQLWSSVEPTLSKEDAQCSTRNALFSISLTSSCVEKRHILLKKIIFSDIPKSLSELCWLAFKCEIGILNQIDLICNQLCSNRTCKQIINETCPDVFFIPNRTFIFGHIFFGYQKSNIINTNYQYQPQYICYDDRLCNGFYINASLLQFNGTICRRPEDFPVELPLIGNTDWIDTYLKFIYQSLFQCNTVIHHHVTPCNSPDMYKCQNSSKCISRHQLCDYVNDCDYKDDERCLLINGTCSTLESYNLFKCTMINRCISPKKVGNQFCDCELDEYNICADEYELSIFAQIRNYISFPTICDGFTELAPVLIDGRNETDETECDYWQCNNTYTRCNGFWNCFDGADEVDCDSSSLLQCSQHEHICVSPITYQLMCLPLAQANDGKIDCVGATDEPRLCRASNHQFKDENFYCRNTTNQTCTTFNDICYRDETCIHGSNVLLCNHTRNITKSHPICHKSHASNHTNVQRFLCQRPRDNMKEVIIYFSMDQMMSPIENLILNYQEIPFVSISPEILHEQRCHRGLPLRVWLNKNENFTIAKCLCPPSFYGDKCQYQNQRIGLTLIFQTFSNSRQVLFAIAILLIDNSDERIIHSHQQLLYRYTHHCETKFNFYLVYSTRPKLSTRNYSIHIDIYEKLSFIYRGSLLIPIEYSFLPVYRVSMQITIPRSERIIDTCTDQQCIHGRCIQYFNDENHRSFCQCNRGWSGKFCTIRHICTCADDSLCIGISANNRSICICPLNKWGSQCFLHSELCQKGKNNVCQNGGQCVLINENLIANKQFICICPKGFSGRTCEIIDNKLIITFHKDIILSSTLLFHFIRVHRNAPPENGSTFKTVSFNERSFTVYWSHDFHIVFVEFLHNQFYLVVKQQKHNQSSVLTRLIYPSDRCAHISEIFNETILNLHLLRRIKYYHLPCQKRSLLLKCFYDNTHFCLCDDFNDHHRLANCFEFNYEIQHDCFGQNSCENEGKCLQDRLRCPKTSICICPKCFYGTQCQFSSILFGLSLDAILGYSIQPHVKIEHQPSTVQISAALTIIITVLGFTNGILSLITFTSKETQKIGSGLYLLVLSILTLFTMIIFTVKFSILFIAQQTYMTNRLFLSSQCIAIDFLLRIGIHMDQWLNACVAMERTMTTIQESRFKREKSKQMAKYMIGSLFLLVISTTIHDPFYRRLIDDSNDENEKHRIWCVVTYPTNVRMYSSMINIFHFITPFLINLFSTMIMIRILVRRRARLRPHETYQRLLSEQFRQHLHLLLAPLLLIILAIPRLIISFVWGCMESNNDSWIYLIGYFISFIPPIITFIVFVLPSNLYKREFYKHIQHYRLKIRNRIQPIV
ncbi:unnamed protein product [Adineta ricciae]|uniref:Uncharacterized protein n=1 Tax=Adineta ricciae TaxID=249248 RepID=A0A815QTS8_ADIRI|nr:unnamed protein product [Adineta ricciae]CAF1467622.1 unnamed protein product [Adineta ricciae]